MFYHIHWYEIDINWYYNRCYTKLISINRLIVDKCYELLRLWFGWILPCFQSTRAKHDKQAVDLWKYDEIWWMWHCKIRSRVISRETWVQSLSEIENAVFLVQASILTNAAVLIRNIQMAKQGWGTWGWKSICLRFFTSNLKASFLRKQIFITSCLLKALSPEHLHHPKMHGTVCFQSPQAFPICHELRFRGGKMLKSISRNADQVTKDLWTK